MRLLPESAVATTAAVTEDDATDVAGDTVTEADTLEDTRLLLLDGNTVAAAVVDEATATATVAVATVTAAPAVAALLLLLLRDADMDAVAGAAGGGRLLTKGLLLSRSARR